MHRVAVVNHSAAAFPPGTPPALAEAAQLHRPGVAERLAGGMLQASASGPVLPPPKPERKNYRLDLQPASREIRNPVSLLNENPGSTLSENQQLRRGWLQSGHRRQRFDSLGDSPPTAAQYNSPQTAWPDRHGPVQMLAQLPQFVCARIFLSDFYACSRGGLLADRRGCGGY